MASSALTRFAAALPAGAYSIWAGDLSGSAWLAHRADEIHYAASTMKVALVLAAYREADAGRLDLASSVAVHNEFHSVAGSGTFGLDPEDDSDPQPWARLGSEVALRWLAYRSLVRSSNLATNLVLEAVGLEPVAETLAALGASRSVVARGIEDVSARDTGLHNVVTAADLARTLQALEAQTCASPSACREILDVLAAQQINDAIPVGLPPGTKVAHKSGWVPRISHDAGIVYPDDADPFIFVMCTTSNLSEQEGLDLIGAGAAAAFADRRVGA